MDRSDSSKKASTWIAGEPQKNRWTGLELKDRAVYSVSAYSCSQCGQLELYTPSAEDHLLRPAAGVEPNDAGNLLRASGRRAETEE